MSRISLILFLSYKLEEVTNSCFTVLELQKLLITLQHKSPIEMGFKSKCSILNGQTVYIERSKLNIAYM